jgi:hypothetical protein
MEMEMLNKPHSDITFLFHYLESTKEKAMKVKGNIRE